MPETMPVQKPEHSAGESDSLSNAGRNPTPERRGGHPLWIYRQLLSKNWLFQTRNRAQMFLVGAGKNCGFVFSGNKIIITGIRRIYRRLQGG